MEKNGEHEIDRRDFMTIVFGTIALGVTSGVSSIGWPEEAFSRPAYKPYELALDADGYIIDPNFDPGDVIVPSRREYYDDHYGLSKMTDDERREWLINDMGLEELDEWPEGALDDWLGEKIDLDEINNWDAIDMSEYAPGLQIFESLSREEAKKLGVLIVEGEHPGSSFVGARFVGDINTLNATLIQLGMNLVIKGT